MSNQQQGFILSKYQKQYTQISTLAILLTSLFCMPSAYAGMMGDIGWKVESGDTLYGISRALFPGDSRKRGQLRQDIIKLNPSAFANGDKHLEIGTVLKLPSYVVSKSTRSRKIAPKETPAKIGRPMAIETMVPPANNAPKPPPSDDESTPEFIPVKTPPRPVQPPVRPSPPPVVPAPVAKPQPKAPRVKKQTASSQSKSEGRGVASIGFSFGGEKLVDVVGGPDIFSGNGAQLRVGYEEIIQNSSGYRVSLGLQYYKLIGDDASYRNSYLQLAYQYHANSIVFGLGALLDTGARFESSSTPNAKFDRAIGAVVYLENIGNGILKNWGISATSLNIEETTSGTSIDASRTEIYYSWRF